MFPETRRPAHARRGRAARARRGSSSPCCARSAAPDRTTLARAERGRRSDDRRGLARRASRPSCSRSRGTKGHDGGGGRRATPARRCSSPTRSCADGRVRRLRGRRGAHDRPTCSAPRSGSSDPPPGVATVSSAFYMVVPPFRSATREVLTFTDCAVVRYPTATQLADIAIAAAVDRRRIVGDEPRVAFLSFSTRGSGSGPSVDLVRDGARARPAASARRSPWTENCKGTQRSSRRWRPGRRRTAPSAGGRTCWSSLRSMPGTSRTSWCSGWLGARRSVPSSRGCAVRAAISRVAPSADDIINVAAITALQAASRRPRH